MNSKANLKEIPETLLTPEIILYVETMFGQNTSSVHSEKNVVYMNPNRCKTNKNSEQGPALDVDTK